MIKNSRLCSIIPVYAKLLNFHYNNAIIYVNCKEQYVLCREIMFFKDMWRDFMKRFLKRSVSLLIATVMTTSIFAGCDSEEKSVIEAKAASVNYNTRRQIHYKINC